jgi:hypothetical protein
MPRSRPVRCHAIAMPGQHPHRTSTMSTPPRRHSSEIRRSMFATGTAQGKTIASQRRSRGGVERPSLQFGLGAWVEDSRLESTCVLVCLCACACACVCVDCGRTTHGTCWLVARIDFSRENHESTCASSSRAPLSPKEKTAAKTDTAWEIPMLPIGGAGTFDKAKGTRKQHHSPSRLSRDVWSRPLRPHEPHLGKAQIGFWL